MTAFDLTSGPIPPRPGDPRDQAVADARELQQLAVAQLAETRGLLASERELAAEALEHLAVLEAGWRMAALPDALVRNQVGLAVRALVAAIAEPPEPTEGVC